jgi:peptide/nickel transport system substrate-binding protein
MRRRAASGYEGAHEGAAQRGGLPGAMGGPGMTRVVFLRRTAGGLVATSGLSAFLAACGGSSDDQPAGNGKPPSRPTGTLRVALADEPTTLDPSLAFSVADTVILHNVYNGLVAFNDDYSELVPGLATDWEVSDDAREWTFKLREGVTFHDGEPLDSAAVKASFDFYIRETSGSGFTVGEYSEIVASDPLTVTVRYKAGFPDLARNCTVMRILSPTLVAGSVDAVDRRVQKEPSGTGAFRFVSREAGRSVTVEAFPGYWGDGPFIEQLEFVVVPEESARVAALQAGDIDLVLQVPPTAEARLKQDTRRATVATVPSWTTVLLSIATDLAPFDDLRVRQALAHAVDREAITRAILRDTADVHDSAMPPGAYGYQEPSTTYEYDPERAQELLREAGHTEPVPVRMAAFSALVLASELGQAIAGQLNEAGFDARFEILESAVAAKDLFAPDRENQIFILEKGWVNGGPFHYTVETILTESRIESSELRRVISQMSQTADGPERLEIIGEAQEIVAKELPQVTLWVPRRSDGHIADLEAYVPPKNVYTLLADSYIAS